MLILRSHGFGFADVGLAETPCRFSDAVSVCLTSDFGDLVSSPSRCLHSPHYGDLVSERLRGDEVAFHVG